MKKIKFTPKKTDLECLQNLKNISGLYIIWPERPDNWRNGGKPAQKVFTEVASIIGKYEQCTMLVKRDQYSNARGMLPPYIRVIEMSNDDSWYVTVEPLCYK